jgi:DNA-binding transcriptional MerR regulator
MVAPEKQFIARKLYYRIGEVCSIVGVEAHVLRYWETEFPSLAPPKNKSGQRTYRPKDIELLLTIRNLLYNEGFTIAGARRQLTVRTGRKEEPRRSQSEARAEKPPAPPAQRLNLVREELENILTLLERE